jgi:cytochrome b subunit of formate dehydrogenase
MRVGCKLQILLALVLTFGRIARSAESEGCLNCHQYEGLSRIDDSGKKVADFFVDSRFYAHGNGPHARLNCTDCHTRTEVEVFPHHSATKVDCMRSCHLNSSGNTESRFSHEPISHMLLGSVHKIETLKKSNRLLGSPLSEKQAQCLLCHDEPLFRQTESWMTEDASTQRCKTCHDATLPQDTTFDFWHVHARSMPSRSGMDVVRICATCHSNDAIRKEFKLPDSTATFLAGFHGKALLLGSENTADCLHCHAGLGQNVHRMVKQDDPTSPTSLLRSADTCRTSNCHGTAGARISTAAIHLDVANTHGIEFVIALLFIGIIGLTFGPSLTITGLKLVHYIIGKHDPAHRRNSELVQTLLSSPEGRAKLVRFQVHQRVQHWVLSITFTLLCLTGFPMKFADRPWAATVIGWFGGLPTSRMIHHAAGTFLIGGFCYHLVYVLNMAWRLKKKSGQSFLTSLRAMPMCATPRDAIAMLQLTLYLMFLRKTKPVSGKFNPEEKFEYFGVFWGTFVLGTTGVLMWANAWTSRHLPGRVLTIATFVHTFEAFLALLHIGIVHLARVIFVPAVFPISRAMITGQTPAAELAEGHGAMLEEVAAQVGLAGPKEAPHV